MKEHIQELIGQALEALRRRGEIPPEPAVLPQVGPARDPRHGDYASNIALVLAKAAGRKPRELAEAIVAALPASDRIERVELAGPGFINLFLTAEATRSVVAEVLAEGDRWGRGKAGAGQRVQVEFVSANPTGPLHVGHGRGAAYGATVADLLEAAGFEVHREYYVNDAGRQMDILATSVWLRYLELCGEEVPFPSNGYRGDYVWDIAATLHREHALGYHSPVQAVLEGVPPDAPAGDKEQHIDALIGRARTLLGDNRYRYVFELALNTILDDIRGDLEGFGVHYDQWYSERALVEHGAVNRAIELLRERDQVYEEGGALWFRSTAYGDEKDRVVQRENGQTTYFASDIAYHLEKLERGFDRVVDVWGADHHGYVPRVKAALAALGRDPDLLDVLLVQFAVLYRGGKKLQMSTRSGEFVTLRELRREVGADAARFFYVMRKADQHLDFDLDLAKAQSADNPVYYIQYAHARVCSVERQMREKGLPYDQALGLGRLALLTTAHEAALLKRLRQYPETVENAALAHEPHQLAGYLRELANDFHACYNAETFLVEDEELRSARLSLVFAVRQTLRNGLRLLGVSAPESM